jgi:hypothetical protein
MYRDVGNGLELYCLKVLHHSQSCIRDHFGTIWNGNEPFACLKERTDFEKQRKEPDGRYSRYASSNTLDPLVLFSEFNDYVLKPFHLSLVKVFCLDNRNESASKSLEASAIVFC